MKKKIFLIVICLVIISVFNINKVFADPVTTYMQRIDINFDTNKLRISPAYDYHELMYLFEMNWTYPDNVHYHDGSNVYFAYCPTDSPCEYEDSERINTGAEYDMQVLGNRYHWVEFEVEAENCLDYGTVCDYDFDEEHLDQIEVYVNGTKVTNAVVDGYNDYWHLVRVHIPMAGYLGIVVKSIEINTESNYVQRGTAKNFTADVGYYGTGGDAVTWSVSGNISSNTKINQSGVLTVDHDEEADYVVVRVTSAVDNTMYDEKYIYLQDEPLSITDVTIREQSKTVVYGGTYTFYARANGTGGPAVTWSLTGANKAGTTISEDGTLTVAADETATSVVVTATSVFDNTKSASLTVTTRATEYVHKIEIEYDTDAVVFSTKTTYGDARDVLEDNWNVVNNVGYDEGTNDIRFRTCETLERCDIGNMGYITSSDYMTNVYTYATFEIFAVPSGDTNDPNPEYDFEDITDENHHIENIEIWVNGIRRDDAFAYDYNEAWRMVHVYVPVTVSDAKLAQYFEFNYDEYPGTYGQDPFNNYIRSYNHIGDGEITFESSDTSVATVDSEGLVTIKKIGTSTITATAHETENYKEYSRSYTLTVDPKYVHISITGHKEETYYYTASQQTPEVTVTYMDMPLVKDIDYVVTYGENTNTGYAYIYVNPVDGSNYTFDDSTEWFWIYPKNVSYDDITINPTSVIYNGSPKEVHVTVVVDGHTLLRNTDYYLTFSGNTSVGTAWARIECIGNYNGILSVPFEIIEADKGDMNRNGKIDLADIIILLRKYLNDDATPEEIEIGDMDDNGSIGLKDIIDLLKVYLNS